MKGHQQTVEILTWLYNEGLCISVITFAEVYEGIYRFVKEKRNKLEESFQDFLSGVQILNIDENIVKIFAEQRSILRKENKLIDNFDLLIGSTAIYYNLELLTNNVKHFERINNLKLHNLNDFSDMPNKYVYQ